MIQDFIDSGDNLKTKEYRYKIGEEINIGNFHAIITEISRKQGRKSYKYECLKCGYEGEKLESLIYKGFGCPCCANRIIIPGINDIPTTDPWMIQYFQGGDKEASLYSRSCKKMINPKCPNCGRTCAKQTINNIYTHKGVSCVCKDGISIPNKIIYFVMEQLSKNKRIHYFEREFYVEEYNKFYDIYFETNTYDKYFIEMDGGIGHGYIIKKHKKSKGCFYAYPSQIFRNDLMKDKLAESLNTKLIRIDCYYSDFEYIKNNILNSMLSHIVDLSSIDWKYVEKQSCSNLIKTVCDYKKYNPDVFVKDAANKFGLNPGTIRKYWSKGNKFGWCTFDREDETKRSRNARTYYGQSRPVILEDINSLKVIEFYSISDFIKNNYKYFKKPLTKKMVENKFKNDNDFIKNYEGYNIYKLESNYKIKEK